VLRLLKARQYLSPSYELITGHVMLKQKQIKYFTLALLAVFFLFLLSGLTLSQHYQASINKQPASLVSGLGNVHHPVSTSNAEAQRFFDQGLTFIYAFNHYEAVRSFKRAAELDSNLAMAYWGSALALGSNYNANADPASEKAAYEAVQKALSLVSKVSENERDYIEALAKRYSINPKADLKQLAVDYKNAMGEIVKRYPDDLDAATLYAESAMNLRPWELWNANGQPAEGTEEIVAVLESVFKRDPQHIGALHYYIHAVEASSHPEKALAIADRLGKLVPAAGHLVHMPAHIYIRIGDYAAAARSNQEAVEVDQAYIKSTGVQGFYPLNYYSHNLYFLATAYMMGGQFKEAKKVAEQLEADFGAHLKHMPPQEFLMPASTFVLVRFHRWNDILKSLEPSKEMSITNAFWHFGQGMAYAATNKIDKAEAEEKVLIAAQKRIPREVKYGLNNASSVLKIAELVLNGKIAIAKHDNKSAIGFLTQAVKVQDSLNYDEPQDWFFPVRESLGGVLMLNHEYKEAEKVFRTDLEKNQRNGRSLFGLRESLKAQGRKSDAQWIQSQFETAWKNADTQLRVEEL
jgi:tetratricopeptide (TPR) repeat protein